MPEAGDGIVSYDERVARGKLDPSVSPLGDQVVLDGHFIADGGGICC